MTPKNVAGKERALRELENDLLTERLRALKPAIPQLSRGWPSWR